MKEELDIFVRQIAVDPNHNEIIYAAVTGAGVSNLWRSTESGTTWQDIIYNLPRKDYTMAINPHPGSLFAGGAVGTWVLPPPYESSTWVLPLPY